ncbi:hypothetical protein MBRA1_001780 [Malassezia brasiliensis]|uniref:Prenylcysteine lyase domain-containing protein n=1 Tax=Malassezia brasiliensis TaxID=1821822 RepID=A0AAF0DS17_9BASI|nr:hypothetical protein MBRA1_001780 [Malassezia brasiliensis]
MKSFQRIYSPRFLHDPSSDTGYPWPSVAALAEQIEARELVSQSAQTYFAYHKVSEVCIDELFNAATRANYAQDIQNIHAFAGLVSMAANGPNGVEGGNAQIFEHMLRRSNATVYRGASGEVTGIMKIQSETTEQDTPVTQWRIGTRDGHSDVYDVVLIAAPWHSSDITLLNTEKSVPGFRYQRVHVTLVVTDAPQPNPVYFGFDRTFDRVPRTIVTTHLDGDNPDFLSLSYQRRLKHTKYHGQTWDALYVVKLFSWAPIPSKTINKIFGNGKVVWTHEKSWSAFPKLTPTDRLGQFEVDTNLYNVNAMERLVSTMETSTLAAKNVVGLVLQKWLGSYFVHGVRCKWSSRTPDIATAWDSWGCHSS